MFCLMNFLEDTNDRAIRSTLNPLVVSTRRLPPLRNKNSKTRFYFHHSINVSRYILKNRSTLIVLVPNGKSKMISCKYIIFLRVYIQTYLHSVSYGIIVRAFLKTTNPSNQERLASSRERSISEGILWRHLSATRVTNLSLGNYRITNRQNALLRPRFLRNSSIADINGKRSNCARKITTSVSRTERSRSCTSKLVIRKVTFLRICLYRSSLRESRVLNSSTARKPICRYSVPRE